MDEKVAKRGKSYQKFRVHPVWLCDILILLLYAVCFFQLIIIPYAYSGQNFDKVIHLYSCYKSSFLLEQYVAVKVQKSLNPNNTNYIPWIYIKSRWVISLVLHICTKFTSKLVLLNCFDK